MTDERAVERLESEGLEDHQITPELVELVQSEDRKSRFQRPSQEWIRAQRDHPVAVRLKTGKCPRPAKPNVSWERLAGRFDMWRSIMLEAADKPTQNVKDVKRASRLCLCLVTGCPQPPFPIRCTFPSRRP